MRNYFFLISLTLIVLVLTGCFSPLPSSPNPGVTPPPGGGKFSLTGIVEDGSSSLSLWSGTATLNGQTVPIREGAFQFTNLAPGTYKLVVSKQFYKPVEKQVIITNSNITQKIKLSTTFTSSELDLLARLVRAEAAGESYEGQVAVAASVLNRVVHKDYPNTLSGVINQVVVSGGKKYYQFEPVLNGTIKVPAGQTAVNAVADALAGWDPSLGATGFFAPRKVGPSSWVWSRPATITIGNHRFFK